jgi:hypothetical protein
MAVGKQVFEREINDSEMKFTQSILGHPEDDEKFMNFWRCLCICHDVIQMRFGGDQKESYTGSS